MHAAPPVASFLAGSGTNSRDHPGPGAVSAPSASPSPPPAAFSPEDQRLRLPGGPGRGWHRGEEAVAKSAPCDPGRGAVGGDCTCDGC